MIDALTRADPLGLCPRPRHIFGPLKLALGHAA
jgi:hypothetical protein